MSEQLLEAAEAFGFDYRDGWPDEFDLYAVAKLQSFAKGMTKDAKGVAFVRWFERLKTTVASGDLKGERRMVTTREAQPARWGRRTVYDGLGNRRELAVLPATPAAQTEVTYIGVHELARWLARWQIEPSAHIAAWLAAKSAKPAAKETAAQRGKRYYDQCLAAGLDMTSAHRRLPAGIAALAEREGISRQAYTHCLKTYIVTLPTAPALQVVNGKRKPANWTSGL